jgi:hypothetical protein
MDLEHVGDNPTTWLLPVEDVASPLACLANAPMP